MKKHIFYLLSAALCLLAGCTEHLETDPFGLSKNAVDFTAEGGEKSITVNALCDCTLSCGESWVTFSPQYVETGKNTVIVTAAPNPTFTVRQAAVMILNEEFGVSDKIAVRQSGVIPRIDCDAKLDATCIGGTFSIEVDSNITWEASTTADWIALSPVNGQAGKSTLSVKISQSLSEKSRRSEIILTNAEHKVSRKIAVSQSGIIPSIDCSVAELDATCIGGTFSIEVDSNITWEASTTADWIALSPVNGQAGKSTLSVKISQSLSEKSRRSEIILTNAEHKVSRKITVIQMTVAQLDKTRKILYTTDDNKRLYFGNKSYFNANIIEHLYDNGSGILIFDEPVTSIKDYAFYDFSNLTSITIPDSVTEIGQYAFGQCRSLTNITIPDSVIEIGRYAFSICSNLTSITIPDGVTNIGEGLFCECRSLTRITIPDGVNNIGMNTFSGCSSLTSITIPDGVTDIGNFAFSRCSSLTHITIPDSVTEIGQRAFDECSSLKTVYCRPQNPPSLGYCIFDQTPSNLKIYVPRASVDKYKSASWWSSYSSQIVGYDF